MNRNSFEIALKEDFSLTTDNMKNEKVIDYERPSNERLLPTDIETLGNKQFLYGLWMYLQSISKCNHIDGYRYVKVRSVNYSNISSIISNLSKDNVSDSYFNKPISIPTIKKGIKYLLASGLIVDIVDGANVFENYSGEYYKLKNWFNYYVLMEESFITMLLKNLSQDAIKVYMVYYSFNFQEQEGICYLNQDEILKRIGLSNSGQNQKKLWHINDELVVLGLIEKYQLITRVSGREVKRKNVIKAKLYWRTRLYDDMKKEIDENGEIIMEQRQLIKII